MSIGIIIFIISIIVTAISAIRDKSHEDRQNQRPPQKSQGEQQPKKGVSLKNLRKLLKNLMMN